MSENKLWLISMPIGNDLDITKRAIAKLTELNQVWCEDTRTFKQFCKRNEIDYSEKKIVSFHDHSEEYHQNKFFEAIATSDIAYVSEAGSPYISDPAHNLVQVCIKNNIEVKSCPGVSSVILGLELSGLPAIPFSFHGFLPRNDKGKRDSFESCLDAGGTHLFFEGVSRVIKTLNNMVDFFPEEANFAVMREMSKTFESVYRFTKASWPEVRETIIEKGEFVIAISVKKRVGSSSVEVSKVLGDIFKKGAKPKLVSKLIAELTGEDSKEVYLKYFSRD